MLVDLSIKNFALIDDVHVRFDDGLTIITGETGAGKSILLGGLALILGKRAELSSIKNSSKKCVIEATFNVKDYDLEPFFNDEGLDYDAETIIRREILPSGKSRAFVNDSPVNLSTLSTLGEQLIDIHSQHQTLEIAEHDFQFKMIDALADNEDLLKNYVTELNTYKRLKSELNALQTSKAEALRERDYDVFLLQELNEAQLASENIESLEEEQEVLSNVEDIQSLLNASYQLMNDDQIGLSHLLNELKSHLKELSQLASNYDTLYQRMVSASIEIEDISNDIERSQEQVEADPERLVTVNSKLQMINALLQKHAVSTIDELLSIQNDLYEKTIQFETIDDVIEEKKKALVTSEASLNKIANVLHERRKKAIPNLNKKLQTILKELGMMYTQFDIEVTLQPDFKSNGKDHLKFLFTSNKGQPPKPLKQVASGGELSRIMLAIKFILSAYVKLPTIMFDEIDTGVSGEISNRMAGIMKQMSHKMQVFTITHLPQIAAKGDAHFKVYKINEENETKTHLLKLNDEERIVEIAQMLGGTDLSPSAIAHAKQLLN